MPTNATTLNLASVITHHARLTPQREAIVCGATRLTYGELDKLSNKVANVITSMGIGYDDKVALCCPNVADFPAVYYGIMKTGAVVVPLNVLFKSRDFVYHLSDSDAKAVLVFQGTADLPMALTVKEAFDQVPTCEQLVVITMGVLGDNPLPEHPTLEQLMESVADDFDLYPTRPDDTCSILYTSGTTGQAKGAELTHENIYLNSVNAFNMHFPAIDFTKEDQQSCLITLPLFHTTGQTVQMNANMYGGNRCVLMPRFEPQAALEMMAAEKINFWIGVPTMYWAILKFVEESGFDVSEVAKYLKVPTSGGAPMPVEVMQRFEKVFGLRVLEGYGLTETSPIASFNQFARPSKPGTVGQPLMGVEIKCFDDDDNEVPTGTRGEVVIRGHNVMKGYYKRPGATAEAFRNGWFHSGDIGVIDDEGYLSIVDRKKDMILRGGYNVYPRELEEIIMTHPAVSLCAVIGVPCERLGEEVKAFVVLKQGEQLSEADFIEWCRTQIAANKYPRQVEFRSELPIGGTGKIFKRALRAETA
ncbi:MAG: long-chain fatty acid--CoA ligase [Pyrinomonadaceae bacterium]